jgi:hypothetical protein
MTAFRVDVRQVDQFEGHDAERRFVPRCRADVMLEPTVVAQQGRAVDGRRDEVAGLERQRVQHGVVRGDRLGESADRGAVRVAKLVLQSAVLERGAGVITERQQQLVADLASRPAHATATPRR